jgi:hypothetical protein
MELTTNELRIGNILAFGKPEFIEEVNYITSKTIGLSTDLSTDTLTPIGLFQPIPLTEDWLVKLGFEKIPNHSEKKAMCDFIYGDKMELCYDVDTDSFYLYNWEQLEIKYVHQLQNLYFSLMNKELTLKSE